MVSSAASTLLLRRMASTLATRIFGLKGFVIYSSTPRSKPCSSSFSSLLAVSIIIGTLEYCLISRHTCQPSIFGIITSRMISAISFTSKNLSTASSPSPASITVNPFFVKKSFTSFLILLSSSTTKIFKLSIYTLPHIPLGYSSPFSYCIYSIPEIYDKCVIFSHGIVNVTSDSKPAIL